MQVQVFFTSGQASLHVGRRPNFPIRASALQGSNQTTSMGLQAHSQSQAKSRRNLLFGMFTAPLVSQLALATLTATCHGILMADSASASLMQFPANHLKNRYFLVCAGTSYSEGSGKVARNPVWKTSQRYGLSTDGVRQVQELTLPALQAMGACEDSCWLWPSIWQNAYMTAEILAYELDLGRSRVVPEYSFLDARGLGDFEDGIMTDAVAIVSDADAKDVLWRPPKGQDGTPNESVQDVLIRVRQMLSVTETQYQGEDILIISPDSDNLSILQAAVLGVDLSHHERFALPPGGVRALQLSQQGYDESPRRLSCSKPPSCLE